MKLSICSERPVLTRCSLPGHNFQIDPYVGCAHLCRYCYALNQAETDWQNHIQKHRDITGQLARELNGIQPQRIYLGYFSDPYQPCEAMCLETRKVLSLLLEKGFTASILTKSDLFLRDLDLLGQMPEASVGISVAFTNERQRKLFEANTIPTKTRVRALAELKKAGIRTTALLCPVIPLITRVRPLLNLLAENTGKIWIYGLSITDRQAINRVNCATILKTIFQTKKTQ